jgi:broad specificity phosphatase PhoE
MTDLWLVRHGQTDWNIAGRWQGQSPDAPALNAVGRAQAFALQDQIKNAKISAVYTSDLPRSRQTAELIAPVLGPRVTPEPRLREMHLGRWEGMLSSDIKAQFRKELAERADDPLHARAPGGESPLEVARRVVAAVDEIAVRHREESVLIVAHGISLAIITCIVQGIGLEKLYEYIPDNAKLFRFKWKAPVYSGGLIKVDDLSCKLIKELPVFVREQC